MNHRTIRSIPCLLVALCLASATACALPAARTDAEPSWSYHMAAGMSAAELGRWADAMNEYRLASAFAREHPNHVEELSFSVYRVGDILLQHPGLRTGEGRDDAETYLRRSLAGFEQSFGDDHPILMPVLTRLARIEAERGDSEAAALSLARSDRIGERFFPPTHFLRDRFGRERPASLVHPLEVLGLLETSGDPRAAQTVRGGASR